MGSRVADWHANGVLAVGGYAFGGQDLPADNDRYTFRLTANADSAGEILLSGRRAPSSVDGGGGPSFGVFLNAIELDELMPPTAPEAGLAEFMYQRNATAYVRIPFTVTDPTTFQEWVLRIRYDDGFMAYVNGTEVVACHAPTLAAWDATATTPHSADVPDDICFILPAGLVRSGPNLLAFHGLNLAPADPDWFLAPELSALRIDSLAADGGHVPSAGGGHDQQRSPRVPRT